MAENPKPAIELVQASVIESIERLSCLAGRWADESQYEDIEDYRKEVAKVLPGGMSVSKMIRRPFGFLVSFAGQLVEVKFFARKVQFRTV